MNAAAKAAEVASRKNQILLEEAQSAIERRPSGGQSSSYGRFWFLPMIITSFIDAITITPYYYRNILW